MTKKALIVCQTPFHLWLVEEIFKNTLIACEVLLVLHEVSPKVDYYVDRLSKKNNKIIFHKVILPNNSKINILKSLLYFNKYISVMDGYHSVYVAGINSIFIHKLLTVLKFDALYTYDDGVGNLFEGGELYRDNITISQFFLRKLFCIKYNVNSIRKEAVEHYTIYKDFKNISNRLRYIEKKETHNCIDNIIIEPSSEEVCFFLGQPYQEFYPRIYSILDNILKCYNIKYYYPHPREVFLKSSVDVVEEQMIFEDYLHEFVCKNPNTKIIIYAFISTALLNVGKLDSVKRVALYDDTLLHKYQNIYNILSESGVELKRMDF